MYFTLDEEGIKWAIRKNKFNLIKLAYQLRVPAVFSSRNIIEATIAGNLDLVQWFYYNCPESLKVTPINWAAYHGYLDIVTWLYINKCGHVNCSGSCLYSGAYTLETAASKGHLDIVKWLYSRGVINIKKALQSAKENNHPLVVEWLEKQSTFSNEH